MASPPARFTPAAALARPGPGAGPPAAVACPLVLADLETLAALDLDPEYILAFCPPRLYGRIRDRLARPGWWELLTIADYEAGNPPGDGWILEADRSTAASRLATRAREVPGYPVALEPGDAEIKAGGPFARWHAEPLSWVRRDT